MSLTTQQKLSILPRGGVVFVDCQGLGDVVQSLPLLKAVCHWAVGRFPVYVLFTSPGHYDLVRKEGLALLPFFVRRLRRDPAALAHLWARLAGKVNLLVCPPEISAHKLVLLKYAIGARYAVGEASALCSRFLNFSAKPSWDSPYLATQDEIAAALGFDTPMAPPFIHLTPQEISWAESELCQSNLCDAKPIIGVQCSSLVPSKSWPAENFAFTIGRLRSKWGRIGVISFGIAAEKPCADLVRLLAPSVSWHEGAGRWTIRQTLAMLSRCRVFISGDTGLMHMAAAVGVPTVSIFGPTSASRRAPRHNGGIALCPMMRCYPCFRGRWTPCDCIRRITPQSVIDAVQFILEPTTTPEKILPRATCLASIET